MIEAAKKPPPEPAAPTQEAARILFTWEGQRYSVSPEVYFSGDLIKLPNGETLQVSGWTETNPPAPSVINRDDRDAPFYPATHEGPAEPPAPPLVLKDERFTLSKFKRELPVKLSELQLAIKAGAAADAFEIARGHREKEELAKVTAKHHKDEAERAEGIGREHMLAYHKGTEDQQVDCEKVLVWLTKEVQIIRKDTGALVDRRAATAEEIQSVTQTVVPGAEKPPKEEATEKKGKKRGRKKKEPTLQ